MTESTAGEVRYLLSDGLGSVRQGVDESAGLVSYQEFDPYGNVVQAGEGVYGYTGEWWQDEVGLLHLRARWYLPSTGTFLSRDAWEGSIFNSHSMNSWLYVLGNSINLVDPSGFSGQAPLKPTHNQWIADGGPRSHVAKSTYGYAIDIVINHREHIIAAAQRHGLIRNDLCSLDPDESQNLYALAAIIYQESVGWYREINHLDINDQPSRDPRDSGQAQVWGNLFGFGNSSIGIAQIRPETTAREIENDGLLYDPYQSTTDNPIKAAFANPTFAERLFGQETPRHLERLSQLQDPVWAIEYAAANLERGTVQLGFSEPSLRDELGQPMSDWQKMASWYNQGVFDINTDDLGPKIVQYMRIIWSNMSGIEKFDVLGIRMNCEDCPPYLPLQSAPSQPLPLQSAP